MEVVECPNCAPVIAQLTEQCRRKDALLKRTVAELEHAKMSGTVRTAESSEEIAANMPDPDVYPEPHDPTQRFVKRPPLV